MHVDQQNTLVPQVAHTQQRYLLQFKRTNKPCDYRIYAGFAPVQLFDGKVNTLMNRLNHFFSGKAEGGPQDFMPLQNLLEDLMEQADIDFAFQLIDSRIVVYRRHRMHLLQKIHTFLNRGQRIIILGRSRLDPVRHIWRYLLHIAAEASHSRVVDKIRHRDTLVILLLDPGQNREGHERISSQFKQAVIHPDRLHPELRFPQLRDLPLPLISRRDILRCQAGPSKYRRIRLMMRNALRSLKIKRRAGLLM
ncbi:hypothetical protein D3C73_702600 [compost metagenome]